MFPDKKYCRTKRVALGRPNHIALGPIGHVVDLCRSSKSVMDPVARRDVGVPRTALGTCPVDGGWSKKEKEKMSTNSKIQKSHPKKSSKKKSHPFRHPLVLNQVVVVIHTKEHERTRTWSPLPTLKEPTPVCRSSSIRPRKPPFTWSTKPVKAERVVLYASSYGVLGPFTQGT